MLRQMSQCERGFYVLFNVTVVTCGETQYLGRLFAFVYRDLSLSVCGKVRLYLYRYLPKQSKKSSSKQSPYISGEGAPAGGRPGTSSISSSWKV